MIEYSVYFFALCIISALSYWFLLRHPEIDVLKKKNETGERFASQSKPIIGGSIFFICIILAFIYTSFSSRFGADLPDYTILICVVIAFGMGCIDDLKNFSPLFKLIFQIICAGIFIYTNNYIQTSDNIFLNSGLTVLWVVGIMNSINMLDNMDGITASVSTIIFATIACLAEGWDVHILLAIVAGLVAFLIWNWHPSKMYMGDNGSQLLGLLLAYFSIKYVWNSGQSIIGINYEQLLFIGLMFIIPLTDTITVAINRFLGGRSPFVGDKYHTTHCLVYKGLSIPTTVTLMSAINAIGCILSWYFIYCKHATLSMCEAILLFVFIFVVFISAYILNLIIRKENNLLYKKSK